METRPKKRRRRRSSLTTGSSVLAMMETDERDRKTVLIFQVARQFFLFFAFIATLLYIFSIPFEELFVVPGVGSVSRAIGIPLLGLWIIVLAFNPLYRRINFFFILAAVFVAWIGLSRFWADVPEITDFALITYVQLLLSSLCIWFALDTVYKCKIALQVFVVGAWVAVFFVFYNYQAGNLDGNRATIGSSDQNELALMLAMSLPAALFLATHKNGSKAPNFLLYILNLVFIPLGLLAIIMTGSRGGALAAVPALMLLLFNLRKANFISKMLLGVMIVGGAIVVVQNLPEEQFERIASTQEEIQSGDISGRGGLWLEAYELWSEDFETMVGGIGSGHFILAAQYVVHNTHLSILTEMGIVGFTIYMGMLISLVFIIRRSNDSQVKIFLYCFLFSWFVGATALSWEYRKPTWLVWSLVICIGAAFRDNSARSARGSRARLRKRRIDGF